jgi:hypothetical protein
MSTQHRLHRAAPNVAAAAAALALAACGGAGDPSGAAVTVTVTPTVAPSTSTGPGRPAAPRTPSSDVVGRRYDFGTVAKVSTTGATTVLELDRWTWGRLDDAELAAKGVPTGAFKGKAPYTNQNSRITFTIPVVDGARVLYNHCVAFDQPLQTRSATVQELADLGNREDTVLVQLDDKGRLTSAENIPGCPG